MTYTNSWFESTAKANFEKYLLPLKGKPDLKFLEIGCYEGLATVWMLENVLTDSSSGIVTIDTFDGGIEHTNEQTDGLYYRFMQNIDRYKSKVRVLIGESRPLLSQLKRTGEFDFVYVDGSHEAMDVLDDAIGSFRLLKKEGIMIFDDYEWGQDKDSALTPRIGIDTFLDVCGNQLKVLLKSYQVVIQKK